MSEEVKSFIDQIANGDNAAAGDAFKDALRMKVGDALDNHRKDVAILCLMDKQNLTVIQNQLLLIQEHLMLTEV